MAEELTATNNQTPATDSWLAGLPDELRSAESLTKFKDVSALAELPGS